MQRKIHNEEAIQPMVELELFGAVLIYLLLNSEERYLKLKKNLSLLRYFQVENAINNMRTGRSILLQIAEHDLFNLS